MLLPLTVVAFASMQAHTYPEFITSVDTSSTNEAVLVAQASTTVEEILDVEEEVLTEEVNPEPVLTNHTVDNSTSVALYPALIPICSCESTGSPYNTPRQYKSDGTVLTGIIHSPDSGMCQINKRVWLETAISLGYDIDTEEGNIRMANYIYEQGGTQPWNASRHCWSKVLE